MEKKAWRIFIERIEGGARCEPGDEVRITLSEDTATIYFAKINGHLIGFIRDSNIISEINGVDSTIATLVHREMVEQNTGINGYDIFLSKNFSQDELRQVGAKIYVKENEIMRRSLRPPNRWSRVTNCHGMGEKCGRLLDSRYDSICPSCGWIKCNCGACGCNFKNR